MATAAYAGFDPTSALKPHTIDRRDVGPRDVAIDITHCGVCHSDIHWTRSEWFPSEYPLVPGHEIVGRVTAVGNAVTRHKVGDLVGVGCLVDSCESCWCCGDGLEQFCLEGPTGTYGMPDKVSGGHTHGGYSTAIVVKDRFVCTIPDNLDPAGAAPLLCAGITTYSPLRRFGAGPGTRVGVIGLGGLGHMATKLAAAMGAEVVVFSHSPSKVDDARRFGASDVVVGNDEAGFSRHRRGVDLILNTVGTQIPLEPYFEVLKPNSTMVQVGMPPGKISFAMIPMVFSASAVAGSAIGGLPETQEMLDFCGEHNITSNVEVIPMQEINTAWERMLKSDVRYRFSIEMETLR